MKTQNKTIILSTLNSFFDVAISTDIYRENFKNKYNILVSCNDEKSIATISKLKVDEVILGTNIDLTSSENYLKRYSLLSSRVLESIQNGMRVAKNKFNSEIYIHNHADAWILNEDKLLSIIDLMDDKLVSCRGRGFGWYGKFSPVGMIDDHFLILKKEFLSNTNFLNISPFELLPNRNNIHGMLAILLMGSVGLKKINFHSDIRKLEYWDGKKVNLLHNYVKPSSYDTDNSFLHVHQTAFPKEYGKSIQAHYLYSNDIKKGKYIEELLDNHHMNKNKLDSVLNEYEEELNKKLKKYFFDLSVLGRDFAEKQNLINNVDFKRICKNILKKGYYGISDLLTLTHKIDKRITVDSIYPEELYSFYEDLYNKENMEKYEYLKRNNLF
jgi:hypothetical protein